MANQYINTTVTAWLEHVALRLLLFQVRSVAAVHVRQSRAMASARKPVIVRKFSRDWCAGYAGGRFGQDAAELEILDLDRQGAAHRLGAGQVGLLRARLPFPDLANDQANPERLLHKRFSIRPRTAGLWLRMTLPTAKNWRAWRPTTCR